MKKFCLSRSISQEPYIIWLSFMVQMCKMIISPGCFFNFSKFWFSWCQRDWKGKKRPKMTKNYVCLTLISRTIHQNDDTSSHFFYFSKFWFQNDLKLPISVCFLLISGAIGFVVMMFLVLTTTLDYISCKHISFSPPHTLLVTSTLKLSVRSSTRTIFKFSGHLLKNSSSDSV